MTVCRMCDRTVPKGRRLYCSDRCFNRYTNSRRAVVHAKCLLCGKAYKTTHRGTHFCSKSCGTSWYLMTRPMPWPPDRLQAKRIVRRALDSGELVPTFNCELCHHRTVFTEAHHQDYGRPLDVDWLCRGCHMKVHQAVRELRVLAGAT